MAVLEIVNPIALPGGRADTGSENERSAPAPRLDALRGKTLGLFWNGKAHGGLALQRVRENLAERYPNLAFRDYYGVHGNTVRRATPELLDRMASECDAVIGTSAD
jgi:hypothetical protein